jgi:DNA-binding transcriptional LysR family regulator
VPTDEANELYEYASMVIFQLDSFNNTAKDLMPLNSNDINVGTTPSIMQTLMPEILEKYKKHSSNSGFNFINLNSNELLNRLVNKSLDIVICFDPAISNRGSNQLEKNALSKEIIHEGMHVMISPKNTFKNKPHHSLNDFADHPFVEITNLISFYGVKSLTEHFRDKSITNNIVAKSSSYAGAASLVELGIGNALVDNYTAKNCDSSKVDIFKLKESLPYKIVLLHDQSKAMSDKAKDFYEFIKSLTNKI